jgi:hypothetical protein
MVVWFGFSEWLADDSPVLPLSYSDQFPLPPSVVEATSTSGGGFLPIR